jgi:hypothetical protein
MGLDCTVLTVTARVIQPRDFRAHTHQNNQILAKSPLGADTYLLNKLYHEKTRLRFPGFAGEAATFAATLG